MLGVLLAPLLFSYAMFASAEPRCCLVVGVSDGDALSVGCGEPGAYEQVKVRIAAIDAPEKNQPFGERAKKAPSELCLRQTASIHPRSTDRYGTTIADVECRDQDVARHMTPPRVRLKAGLRGRCKA